MEAVKNVEDATAAELGALLDAGDGAVVTLVAGETRLAAHRAVLAARSPVFAAMFGHDTVEASSGQVAIPDVEGPVLRQLLAYLYTLQAPQVSGTALELLAAADKYCLLALKAHCEQQLVAQLSVENAATVAVTAVRHSCTTLTQAALAFVKAHAFQVMRTQAWAEAMIQQAEDLIEVSRLLFDTPAETRAPDAAGDTTAASTAAAAAATTEASSADQPHSTSPATAAPTTPPPDEAAVSGIQAPAATGDTTTASASTSDSASTSASASAATVAAPCQPQGRTPAAAVPATPPPDEATVSRLRSLSAEMRNRRLIKAAEKGDVEDLRALLAAGADVEARDRGGLAKGTALYFAAAVGRVQAARCLLEAGAQVDATDIWQQTPLHEAATHGHAAVVRLLTSWSADPNARDQWGRTPLHDAARRGHAEAAAALLEAGADRGARTRDGDTPLDLAVVENNEELIQMLS